MGVTKTLNTWIGFASLGVSLYILFKMWPTIKAGTGT